MRELQRLVLGVILMKVPFNPRNMLSPHGFGASRINHLDRSDHHGMRVDTQSGLKEICYSADGTSDPRPRKRPLLIEGSLKSYK